MANEKLIDVTGLKHFRQSIDKKYITANIFALSRNETLAVGNVRYVQGMSSGFVVVCKTAGTTADTAPEYPATDQTDVTDGTAVLTVRNLLAGGEGGATTADKVGYGDTTVADVLDNLTYTPVKISSFTNNVGSVERGRTITDVALYWSVTGNKVNGLKLGEEAQDLASKGKTLTKQTITKDTTWTLTATDSKGAKATATTGIYFKDKRYWGVGKVDDTGVDSAFVLGLSGSELADKGAKSFTVTAADGNYIYYAIPASWGDPRFFIGGFEGGLDLLKTFDLTNAAGAVVSYNVYRSNNPDLGETTVDAKY